MPQDHSAASRLPRRPDYCPAAAAGSAPKQKDHRDRLSHQQPDLGGVRRGQLSQTQTGLLGHREPPAPRAGRQPGRRSQPGPPPAGGLCLEPVPPSGGELRAGLAGGVPQNQATQPGDHSQVPKAIPPPRRRPGTLAGVGLRQVAPVRGEFPSEVAAAVLALEDDAAQPV